MKYLVPKDRHSRLSLAALFLLAQLLIPNTSPAQTFEPTESFSGLSPWKIQADRIGTLHDADLITAWGNVVLSKGDNYLKADFARYYRGTGWVFLKGHVEARWSEDLLSAEEAEFDLKNMVGWLKRGKLFVSKPHLYFEGELIEKHAGDTYSFKDARVTACDEKPSAWSLTMREGEITLDGYAMLWHSRFQVLEHSVMYSPFMILPVKQTRQSGFLLPDVGHSSRLGMGVNLPYYWAVSDETDVTFYENYMSERGLMQGVELRRTPNPDSKDFWRFDWLRDAEKGEGPDEDSQFKDDDLARPNQDRYWWRSKYNGYLGDPKYKAKLDIDWVSDQNYLREFKSGKSGYEQSRETFRKEFNRDIEAKDALQRTSTALLTRAYDNFGVAGRAEYTRDLEFQNGNRNKEKDPTAQRLPEINVYVYKDELSATPLEWEMEAGGANFWRKFGTKGRRFEAHPRVSLPIKTRTVSIIPRAGLRETLYAVDGYENRTVENHDDAVTFRHIPEAGASGFTELFKVYRLDEAKDLSLADKAPGTSRWTRIKHAIQPRVEYDWIPFVSQARKPFFDDADRIRPQNELTYSLTNILDRRRESVVARPFAGNYTEADLKADFLEFFRLRLEQSYDLREASRRDMRAEYPRRPFSDVLAELAVKPGKYVSLINKTYYSTYLDTVTEHEHTLKLEVPGRASASFGLDFMEGLDEFKRRSRERIRMLRLGVEFILSKTWSTGFEYRADLVTNTDLEKSLSVTYSHQCFGLTFHYTQTPFEDRVEARLDLLGLSL
ncbi:MAG: LPS assembly protein LptD [Thermodesulfobacteriota bacterium]|nr:LPS assembly protein LptD [Thermodesulfobacteriota bacterium]